MNRKKKKKVEKTSVEPNCNTSGLLVKPISLLMCVLFFLLFCLSLRKPKCHVVMTTLSNSTWFSRLPFGFSAFPILVSLCFIQQWCQKLILTEKIVPIEILLQCTVRNKLLKPTDIRHLLTWYICPPFIPQRLALLIKLWLVLKENQSLRWKEGQYIFPFI